MPYEFLAKNGLISQGNITATGSLTVTQNISASATGSFGIVGIGTNSPLAALDVRSQAMIGDASIGGVAYQTLSIGGHTRIHDTYRLQFGSANGGFASIGITGATTGTLTFTTWDGSAFAERLRIVNTNGNVGIGTTTVSRKLHTYTDTGPVMRLQSSGSNASIEFIPSSGHNRYNWLIGAQQNISDAFEITPSTATDGTTFSKPSILVKSDGNVGIGITSPTVRLHVSGSSIITNPNPSANSAVLLVQDEGTSTTVKDGTTLRVVNNGSAANFSVFEASSGVSDFVILNSGNVGIGSNSPASKLEVLTSAVGLANQPNIIGNFRGDTDGRSLIRVDNTSTSAGAAALQAGVSFVAYSNTSNQPSANKHEAQIILGSTGATSVSGGQTGTLQIVAPLDIAFNVSASNTIMTGSSYTTFGSNAMYLARSGNVGIGTTSPDLKLSVVSGSMRVASGASAGTIYFGKLSDGVYLERDNNYDFSLVQNEASGNGLYLAGAGNVYVSIDANNNETDRAFVVQNNAVKTGTELFRVNEAGRVGVGTSLPTASIHVKPVSLGADLLILERYASQAKLIYAYESAADGYLEVRNGSDSAVSKLSGYATTPSYFLSNVGIGTTNPGAKLDVSGSSNATILNLYRNVNSATTPLLYGIEAGGSPGKTNIALFERLNNLTPANVSASSAGIRIREHSANYALSVEDHSNNSYLVIKGGGNVGIGTTNPAFLLDVSGSSRFGFTPTNTHQFTGSVNINGPLTSSSSRVNGTFSATKIAEKIVTFTPLTGSLTENPAWYRLISGSGILDSGRVRLSADYDNSRSDLEFTYAVRNYDTDGAGAFINITRASTYNSLFTAIRVIEGTLTTPYAIDVLIGNYLNNTSPATVTCLYESQFISAVLDTPTYVSASATGSNSNVVKTVYTTYTSGYPRIGPAYSDGLAVATYQGQLSVGYRGNYSYNIPSSNNYALLVSGSVGIGTTTLGEKLTVSGNSYIIGSTGAVGTGLAYYLGDSSNRDISLTRVGTAALAIGRYYPSAWTETIRFTADGNVGIGTSSPNSKLEVAGTAGTAIISVNNTTAGRSGSFGIDSAGVYIRNSNDGDYFDLENASGTSRFRLVYDNNTFLNTTYTSVGSLTSSGSKLSVFGNLSVGSSYGSTAAPSNGAIFQGGVGIGTTNPYYAFDVYTNSTAGALMSIRASGSANARIYFDAANGDLSGGDYCYIGQESGSLNFVINTDVNSGNIHIQPRFGSATDGRLIVSGSSQFGRSLSSYHQFTGSVSLNGSLLTNANITASNVSASGTGSFGAAGIGITNPSTKLHVVGSSIIANNTSIDPDSYANTIIAGAISDRAGWGLSSAIGGNAGTGHSWAIGSNGANFYMGYGNASAVDSLQTFLQVSGSRNVGLVPDGGNVGVGTSSPFTKFNIVKAGINEGAISFEDESCNAHLLLQGSDARVRLQLGTYNNGNYGGWIQASYDNSPNSSSNSGAEPLILNPQGGNVGISTVNPGYKLDVNGDIRAMSGSTIRLQTSAGQERGTFQATDTTGAGGAGLAIATSGGEEIAFKDSSDVNMVIKGTGRVGIGTITPAEMLHISSSNNTQLRLESGADAAVQFVGPDTHSYAIGMDDADDKFKISYNASRTPPGLGTNDRLVIDTSGNVGIGTAVPAAKLHVIGDISSSAQVRAASFYTTGAAGSSYFENLNIGTGIYIEGGANEGIYFGDSNRWIIDTCNAAHNDNADGELHFRDYTNSVTRMLIQYSTGRVGIGTTIPSSSLDVIGDIKASSSTINILGNLNSLRGNVSTYGYNLTGSPSGTGWISVQTFHNALSSGDQLFQLAYDQYNQQKLFTRYSADSGATWSSWKTIINSDALSGTTNYIPKFTGTNSIGNSAIYDSGGNVGIATTAPGAPLDVVGQTGTAILRTTTAISTSYAGLRVYNNLNVGTRSLEIDYAGSSYVGSLVTSGPTGESACVTTTGAYPLVLGTSNTARLTILGNGNVGIGSASPAYKLDVAGGDVNFSSSTILRFGTVAVLNESSNANDIYANIRVIRNLSSVNQDGMYIGYGNSGTTAGHLRFYANNFTERMRIDASNGNVGIGITNPAAKLSVTGSGTGQMLAGDAGFGVGNYTGISVNGTLNTSAYNILSSPTDTTLYLNRPSGGNINFRENNSDQMVLLTGGNLGIGTSNPSAKVQISGSANSVLLNVKSPISGNIVYVTGSGAVGINTTTPAYTLQVNGSFAATTKSFVIDHPTKPDKKLVYGSLESPYHGIRLTGRDTLVDGKCVVELPDYISKLIMPETVNIQLTGIKCNKTLYVDDINIKENNFTVAYDKGVFESYKDYDFFWDFTAVRADVPELQTEM